MKAPHFAPKAAATATSSGRTIQSIHDRVNVCLTSDHTRYIYKKGRRR